MVAVNVMSLRCRKRGSSDARPRGRPLWWATGLPLWSLIRGGLSCRGFTILRLLSRWPLFDLWWWWSSGRCGLWALLLGIWHMGLVIRGPDQPMYSLFHICCLQRVGTDAGVHPRTGELFHSRNSIVKSFTHMCVLYKSISTIASAGPDQVGVRID
jgi:hypothetical protein